MDKQISNIVGARKLPFSEAVRVGDWIFVAGQIGSRDHKTYDDVIQGIEPQMRQCFENIKTALASLDSSLEDVVKMTVFLTKAEYFTQLKEIMPQYFPKEKPALSTIVVDLVNPNLLLEIECTAYSPKS